MNYLIANYMLENDVEETYFLSHFLTRFDKGRFDHFVIFGRISKLLGRNNEAKESFQEAVGICKRDKKWNLLKDPECPTTEEVIASTEKEIENLEED